MSFVSKEIRRYGYIVVNDVQVLAAQYHFECDSASDLPSQTQFQNDKNVFLFMGSTAHTIDTDAKYEMNSSGTWIQQSHPWQPLADYSVLINKPEINGHTLTGNQSGADLGLQNTLTFDNTPTQDSTNPVTSGGLYTAIRDKEIITPVVYGTGIDIAATAENPIDLDNLLTVGKYRIISASVSDYITHKPERRAAGIIVEASASTGYLRQTWIPALSANEANYFIIRHYRSSGSGSAQGWSPWYKYEGVVMT